jgi:protein phosphatase/serine/threonine-protein phosphatase Stp1
VPRIDHRLLYRSAARTHVGAVRARNEDAVIERGDIGLWAVADGAGGHQRGDYASGRVIAALSEITPSLSTTKLIEDVKTRLGQVNQELRAKAADIGPGAMICSTVMIVLIADARSCCLWAGDSRCYLLRSGALGQISHDHSYVQNLVDRGEISPEAAAAHPLANVVTNLLGAEDGLALEERWDQLVAGDTLLLCSDGLCHALADGDIAAILRDYPVEVAADRLIESAVSRNATDNVSVVVITYMS